MSRRSWLVGRLVGVLAMARAHHRVGLSWRIAIRLALKDWNA